MEYLLPPKTRRLLDHYLNIRIGPHKFPCPYYENLIGKRGKPVNVGKGLPNEIEKGTLMLFEHFDLKNTDPNTLRLYMATSGFGVDCSGLAVRLINSYLYEKLNITIRDAIKPSSPSIIEYLRIKYRTYTNISANTLTSKRNTVEICTDEVKPADLLRVGEKHVATVVKTEVNSGYTASITYAHSTSDYLENYGVRLGTITIINKKPLEYQIWNEVYKGKNWMLNDYKNAKKDDRGLRRLKIFNLKFL